MKLEVTLMQTVYNLIAGQNLDRLAALSDGVFAVAMTLLVLDLRPPAATAIHNELDLGQALLALSPRLVPYLMTFLTLGIFWVGQQTQLNLLVRCDRNLAWIHIAVLLVITLLPFSTALLADFITFRLALVVYWLNILAYGVVIYAAMVYARCAGLIKDDVPPDIDAAFKRRVVVAQALYALAAALCTPTPPLPARTHP
jgi:uncharacterized membrane protein